MKDAVKHWRMLRVTSLPLIPLFFYFLTQVEYLTTKSRMIFISWLKQPLTTAAVLLFIVCAFYHATLGTQEIIEDYISDAKLKSLAHLSNKLFFFCLGLGASAATLGITFGKF